MTDHSPVPSRLMMAICLGIVGMTTSVIADEIANVDFFETRIRPVLVEHCYECHSSDATEVGGGLWLDSAEAMLVGGDTGPAIQPGNVDESVLVSALRYDSSEMPPSGKLPDEIIRDFEKWIAAGATDPRTTSLGVTPHPKSPGIDLEAGRQFWAFRPLHASENLVLSSEVSWIDELVQSKLQSAAIVPNRRGDADTLLRRLSFDLTGLPPSAESMIRWRADPSDAQWQAIVDEMLASTAFAEHWARHWMDVARYADSNGSDFNATFHDAWRYRDYLISNIADDTPVDQMIRQQIAGDLMPAETDEVRRQNLIATTFLMLGTKMLSERDKAKLTMDVVDEQIDTVGRAFMGMTLGCARCHDHKFDPVPMQDYYALAGIFRSTMSLQGESQKYVSTWKPVPLPTSQDHLDLLKEHAEKLKQTKDALAEAEAQIKKYAIPAKQLAGVVIDDESAIRTGDWVVSTYLKGFIGSGYLHDDNRNKGDASLQFKATLTVERSESGSEKVTKEKNSSPTVRWEARLWYTPGGTRASNVPVEIRIGDETRLVNVDQRKSGDDGPVASLGFFEVDLGTEAVVTVSNAGTSGHVIADAVQWIPQDGAQPATERVDQNLQKVTKLKQRRDVLKSELTALVKAAPAPLPTAMAVVDRPTEEVVDCPLHVRGEVSNLGDTVPRGFLSVCGAPDESQSSLSFTGSGRLELAAWLTDPDHPLTSRVAVNRIWMRLMGDGIVRTVDNFGERGERPSHPELLDSLAVDFMRNGWSRKKLVRQIVMSETYRRGSQSSAICDAVDPENRLLWRANRKRLPAESIRDSMLVIAGSLSHEGLDDPMNGYGTLVSSNNAGSKSKISFTINDNRRTVYLPIIRGAIPALLSALDVADADLLVGKRPTTNVPAQALALMGSSEVRQWAGLTATKLLVEVPNESERVQWVYQRVLQRSPTAEDHELVHRWLGSETAQAMPNDQTRWQQWIAAMFAGTEFRILE
ncbi:DUF1553 domain-containing protein [Rubripirellula reticaptiva]|uniref:Xanthan lyase n=1 Tax=Rubripirellula reticaptiva TaxID=2528013 RepID=A0A5C6ETE2_9BACT|nr:DUF1553 domain-containing protein [Rubripirellula reticaptiva]TWU51965.1 Xanthan lyase precursor [Rubripirellula reticaptiva]